MRKLIQVSVNGGKVSTATREKLLDALAKDGQYLVTIEKDYKRRTAHENAFYWGVFIPLEIECFKEYWGEDYSAKEVHEWNKQQFWADERIVGDEVIKTPTTSTKYSTIEWEHRLDIARTWFKNTFDWVIPYPNEQLTIHEV